MFRMPMRPITVKSPQQEPANWRYSHPSDKSLLYPLLYRSAPNESISNYDPFRLTTVEAQCRLYAWVRGIHYEDMVPLGDLYSYLDCKPIIIGKVINQAMLYQSRRLKRDSMLQGISKPTWCLSLAFREELQYGLEWQICSWLDQIADRSHHNLEEDLDEIADCSFKQIQNLFVEAVADLQSAGDLIPVDWTRVTPILKAEEQKRLSQAYALCSKPKEDKSPPKSIFSR